MFRRWKEIFVWSSEGTGKKYRKKKPEEGRIIPDSSMVEHTAVNRGVVGSSPTRGVFYNNYFLKA